MRFGYSVHTSDGPRLPEQSSTEWDVVDTGSNFFIPTTNNDTRRQRVLVFVAELIEDARGGVYGWWCPCRLPIILGMNETHAEQEATITPTYTSVSCSEPYPRWLVCLPQSPIGSSRFGREYA